VLIAKDECREVGEPPFLVTKPWRDVAKEILRLPQEFYFLFHVIESFKDGAVTVI
jgi:hypothetical protein